MEQFGLRSTPSRMNNIELITDRPLQINLDEIKVVKKDYPDRAVVSLMVPCEEECWVYIT